MGTTDQPRRSLGILGGGQLGMMSAEAAKKLGISHVVIWAQHEDEPAARVANEIIIAPFTDSDACDRFIASCDFVTTEFENVSNGTIRRIEMRRPMRPSAEIMRIASDRWQEKRFFQSIGIPTARTRRIQTADDMDADDALFPALLKTSTLGYDGRGQVRVASVSELSSAHAFLGGLDCVLEEFVGLECEFSIIIARDGEGNTVAYAPIENEHEGGILRRSTWPATHVPKLAAQMAEDYARLAVVRLGLVGIIAFEFMLTVDGRLLANEMAPRPHNSGHGTIEGCTVSQFEQHVRVSCGLPLVEPQYVGPWEMLNLIGVSREEAEAFCQQGDFLHWYDKAEARPGRKMGHITRLL